MTFLYDDHGALDIYCAHTADTLQNTHVILLGQNGDFSTFSVNCDLLSNYVLMKKNIFLFGEIENEN